MIMEKPNFYSVTPATVRYCKELKPHAKLLYGEITALCNKEGFCWASNKYFADLYEVTTHTVSQWVQQLVTLNFIKYEIIDNYKRKIYIVDMNFLVQGPYTKKYKAPIQKSTDNNTTNITDNIASFSENKEPKVDSSGLKEFAELFPDVIPKSKIETIKVKSAFEVSEESKELTKLLLGNIKINFPRMFDPHEEISKSRKKKEYQQIDELHEKGYTFDEIREVIEWSTSNEFWKKCIISVNSLCKNFGKLLIQSGYIDESTIEDPAIRRNAEAKAIAECTRGCVGGLVLGSGGSIRCECIKHFYE